MTNERLRISAQASKKNTAGSGGGGGGSCDILAFLEIQSAISIHSLQMTRVWD